jgi:hypothetical protein
MADFDRMDRMRRMKKIGFHPVNPALPVVRFSGCGVSRSALISIRIVHVCDDFILFLFPLYLSLSSGSSGEERLRRKIEEKDARRGSLRVAAAAL